MRRDRRDLKKGVGKISISPIEPGLWSQGEWQQRGGKRTTERKGSERGDVVFVDGRGNPTLSQILKQWGKERFRHRAKKKGEERGKGKIACWIKEKRERNIGLISRADVGRRSRSAVSKGGSIGEPCVLHRTTHENALIEGWETRSWGLSIY